jgi:hypothetical protein
MATKGAVGKLRRLQTGREATAGTAVAATDRLLGKFRLTDRASKQVPEVGAALWTRTCTLSRYSTSWSPPLGLLPPRR